MNSSEWFYEIEGQICGPVSWRQLKILADTKRLKPSDLIWQTNNIQKRRARGAEGLFDGILSPNHFGNESPETWPSATQIPMVCERCGFHFKIAKEFIGRQGRCPIPTCGQTFVVPEPSCSPTEVSDDSVALDKLILADFPSSKRPRCRKSTPSLIVDAPSRKLSGFIIEFLKGVDKAFFVFGVSSVLVVTIVWSWFLSGITNRSRVVPTIVAASAAPKDRFQENALPILRKYCGQCHSDDNVRGDFSLVGFSDERAILSHRSRWERLTNLVTMGIMPPADAAQLPASDRVKLLEYLDSALFPADCFENPDPGRVTIRRLNRFEYNNTIRDLLGINFQPADDFPSDDVGHGFDNIGEILSLSPLLFEKYLIAAEKIASTAIASATRRSANLPEPLQQLIVQYPQPGKPPLDCIRENLRPFLLKAFRRPVSEEELIRVVAPAKEAIERHESFEFAMQTGLTSILVSPHFLFRVESDTPPVGSQEIRELTGYELASRLSYFLWSSMPDEELLQRAARGDLQSDSVLDAQVHRMLMDWKSSALTDSFGTQWLHLKSLDDVHPNFQQFPEFTSSIKADLKQETKSFFEHVVRQDRSVLEFLDGRYTFVNGRLATYYDLPGVVGDQFQLVSLAGLPRAGLVTQGSIMTLTSLSTRTSPVKRGKWILEAILDQPPPPPPPNVSSLTDVATENASTLRQRLEIHRSNPACASCHQVMDSLGFGMENFDPIGRWRTSDGRQLLDTTGQLPGGRVFDGPTQLISALKERDADFVRALTNKLLTYALGRPLQSSDRCTVNSIVKTLKAKDFHFSVLVTEIVKSRPFRMRRVKGIEL